MKKSVNFTWNLKYLIQSSRFESLDCFWVCIDVLMVVLNCVVVLFHVPQSLSQSCLVLLNIACIGMALLSVLSYALLVSGNCFRVLGDALCVGFDHIWEYLDAHHVAFNRIWILANVLLVVFKCTLKLSNAHHHALDWINVRLYL